MNDLGNQDYEQIQLMHLNSPKYVILALKNFSFSSCRKYSQVFSI